MATTLPQFQDDSLPFQMMQNSWGAIINPILANPLNNARLLFNIPIVTGVNVINHLLSKQQQGFVIIDITAPVTLYRSAPLNSKTLTLTSSGAATISLAVF